jgi:hypothetical protein
MLDAILLGQQFLNACATELAVESVCIFELAQVNPLIEVQTKKRGIKVKELIEVLLQQSPKPLRYVIRNDVVTVVSAQN